MATSILDPTRRNDTQAAAHQTRALNNIGPATISNILLLCIASREALNLSINHAAAPSPLERRPRGRPKGTAKRRPDAPPDLNRRHSIRSAVMKLDPTDSANWTRRGWPSVTPVQILTGLRDISQKELRIACPSYTRSSAAEISGRLAPDTNGESPAGAF